MKRINNLYESVISIDNLKLADQKARKGKTKSYGVIHHDKNKEANIITLHEALKNKTYKTSAYDKFTIYEPKERVLGWAKHSNSKHLLKTIIKKEYYASIL